MAAPRWILVVVLAAVGLTTSCSSVAGTACGQPILDSPRDALVERSGLGVTGVSVLGRTADTVVDGTAVRTYLVSTTGPLHQGDSVYHSALPVMSTPSCDPHNPYPEGDPLDLAAGSDATLFLVNTENGWTTYSYQHGVLPGVPSELPDSWPS